MISRRLAVGLASCLSGASEQKVLGTMSIRWISARRDGETQLSQPTTEPLEKQMALDFAEACRPVQSSITRVFHAADDWLVARQAARAMRASLQNLLLGPEHLLRDIGITREQLISLIDNHRK